MKWPSRDERTAAEGWHCRVEFHVKPSGRMDLFDWMAGNRDIGLMSSFHNLFQELADDGPPLANPETFKKLGGIKDVWEFKKGGYRIFCVHISNRWILTSYYKKGKSTRDQTNAAKQARKMAEDFISQEAGRGEK